MEPQKRKEILETLKELGATFKGCINDLEKESKQPLTLRYIRLDADLETQWDNAIKPHISKCSLFAYDAVKTLLCAKYKSDNLTLYYKDKKLKLTYFIDNAIISTTI